MPLPDLLVFLPKQQWGGYSAYSSRQVRSDAKKVCKIPLLSFASLPTPQVSASCNSAESSNTHLNHCGICFFLMIKRTTHTVSAWSPWSVCLLILHTSELSLQMAQASVLFRLITQGEWRWENSLDPSLSPTHSTATPVTLHLLGGYLLRT